MYLPATSPGGNLCESHGPSTDSIRPAPKGPKRPSHGSAVENAPTGYELGMDFVIHPGPGNFLNPGSRGPRLNISQDSKTSSYGSIRLLIQRASKDLKGFQWTRSSSSSSSSSSSRSSSRLRTYGAPQTGTWVQDTRRQELIQLSIKMRHIKFAIDAPCVHDAQS